jgi:hypothetical protein
MRLGLFAWFGEPGIAFIRFLREGHAIHLANETIPAWMTWSDVKE